MKDDVATEIQPHTIEEIREELRKELEDNEWVP